MSSLPAYLKTWNFTGLNQSVPFVSLNDEMSELLYRIKNYCVGTLGAAVWGSSTGTVGNNTDQWASKANATTRGATTGTANSWIVFAWGTGQLCLSYVGASDDVARISFSPGSLFVLAGTPTFTPTATDEIIVSAAVSIISATASANRVYHILGDTTRTVLRVAVFRQSSMQFAFGVERIIEAPGVPAGTMIVWNSNVTAAASGGAGSGTGSMTVSTTGAVNEMKTYLNGAARPLSGGTCVFNNNGIPIAVSNPPSLNGGVSPFPVMCATSSAGNDGWLGTRYDIICPWTASISQAQPLDDIPQAMRMMIVCGFTAWPWDPAQAMTVA